MSEDFDELHVSLDLLAVIKLFLVSVSQLQGHPTEFEQALKENANNPAIYSTNSSICYEENVNHSAIFVRNTPPKYSPHLFHKH